jgi:S1-C subfamily serine protease
MNEQIAWYPQPSHLPPPPPPPPASPPFRHRRGRDGRAIVGTAVLSAAMASVMTFALVAGFAPTAPTSAGPTQNANAQLAATAPDSDITTIVATATQSVVTITSQGVARDRYSPFTVPATGVGSGIVVTADGLILTNNHVVAGAQSLTVTLASGDQFSATIVQTDAAKDIAVIRADATGLVPAQLGDSDAVKVGETVLAIGSPLGEFTETVTKGILSALDRTITVADEQTGRPVQLSGLLQTDAAINPGNSGGPLINAAGQVVGINSAVSQSAEGIGFAIPINVAKSLISQATGA